ncbi:MAG: ClbS/DfsB family four-helix bundle protein [Actinomycetota bacterium]
MSRPKDREELVERISSDFQRLVDEVDAVPTDLLEVPGVCDDWSVKDLLAHLDAWHELFLGWEEIGAGGGRPDMPAPGLTWRETPTLNEQIWERTRDDDLADVRARLDDSHRRIRAVVESYGDDLFVKRRHAWTGSTSVGSYAVSATTSHYEWARSLIRRWMRTHPSNPGTSP